MATPDPNRGAKDAVLTTPDYWESGYARKSEAAPINISDFRNLGYRKVIEMIESLGIENRRILEVGAGNSAILSHLASKHRQHATFSGLDYSAAGCAMLARRAERERAAIRVLHNDLFVPPPELLGQFDTVYSYGVVEHFRSLGAVLVAKKRLLSPQGRMLTIIPNMAGVLGALTRRYNPAVYDLHVPHDLRSLLEGHLEAELDVLHSGYLCSSNFGVLSSCFKTKGDRGWITYVWLNRLTKGLWFLEARLGDLPHSAQFSPYIYAVSRPH